MEGLWCGRTKCGGCWWKQSRKRCENGNWVKYGGPNSARRLEHVIASEASIAGNESQRVRRLILTVIWGLFLRLRLRIRFGLFFCECLRIQQLRWIHFSIQLFPDEWRVR